MQTPHAHNAALAAHTVHLPVLTWRAQCLQDRHGCSDSWEVQASNQHEAGVMLRIQLRAEGRVMPADLEWQAQ